MNSANIVLVGFMGVGKTTVGRLLAARLGREFVDMDAVIEQRAGKPISAIFSEQGEPHFRALERTLVRELSGRNQLVIAAGGGVVLNPENLSDFTQTGVVICLSAGADTLLKRVEREAQRPLLEGGDKSELLRKRLEARRPLYDAIPNQVDTTDLLPDEVADRVMAICAGG